jgi:hypothetical protein
VTTVENAVPVQTDDGVEGNARLTAATGLVLLVLLAVEGYTILDVRGLITLHIFLGILLVGPVLLKIASTTYRFARYYLGSAEYVRKGPPHIILRVLGPLVTVSSLAVLGTGIGLIWDRSGGTLLTAHQASFIVWVSVMTIHVLGHLQGALRETWHDLRRSSRWRRIRLGLVVASVVVGVGIALMLFPSASSWTTQHHHGFSRIHP